MSGSVWIGKKTVYGDRERGGGSGRERRRGLGERQNMGIPFADYRHTWSPDDPHVSLFGQSSALPFLTVSASGVLVSFPPFTLPGASNFKWIHFVFP